MHQAAHKPNNQKPYQNVEDDGDNNIADWNNWIKKDEKNYDLVSSYLSNSYFWSYDDYKKDVFINYFCSSGLITLGKNIEPITLLEFIIYIQKSLILKQQQELQQKETQMKESLKNEKKNLQNSNNKLQNDKKQATITIQQLQNDNKQATITIQQLQNDNKQAEQKIQQLEQLQKKRGQEALLKSKKNAQIAAGLSIFGLIGYSVFVNRQYIPFLNTEEKNEAIIKHKIIDNKMNNEQLY
jgi:hypothetical protein